MYWNQNSSQPSFCGSYLANSPVSVNSEAVIPTSKIELSVRLALKYRPFAVRRAFPKSSSGWLKCIPELS